MIAARYAGVEGNMIGLVVDRCGLSAGHAAAAGRIAVWRCDFNRALDEELCYTMLVWVFIAVAGVLLVSKIAHWLAFQDIWFDIRKGWS